MADVVLPSRSRLSRVGVVVLALILLALSVQTGLGFTLARTTPALAYRIDPGNPEVAAAKANFLVMTSTSAAAVKQVEQVAREAVAGAPLAPLAVRNLGFAIQAAGRKDEAVALVDIAGKISRRDFLAHAWLLEERKREGRMADAVFQADLMMRQRTSNYAHVMPIMVGLLANRDTVAPLARALDKDPVWRSSFLDAMGWDAQNLENKLALLGAIRQLGSPATNREIAPLFRRAWDKADPRMLRGHWDRLVTLPAGARSGLLIDGGFEYPDIPPPFTWTLYPNQEVYAEIARRPDSGHALFASFEGTRDVEFAGQQLLLAPGRYQLTGTVMGQDRVLPGQFRWSLRCGRDGTAVQSIPLNPTLDRWTRFAATLTVPESCREQQLWLVAGPSDPAALASILVDSLALRKL
jgi:hypothetical protein